MSANITPPPMPGYGPAVPPPVPPPAPPKKTNTVVVATAAAAIGAVVAAVITAGVTGGDKAAGPTPTVTVTKTAGGNDSAAAADEEAVPSPDETDGTDGTDGTDDGVYALTDTVTYESDVEVSLSGFKRSVSGAYADPENTSYVGFTVKIKNGGSKTLDATMLTVNCSYGKDGHSSDEVFDSDAGLNGGPDTKLLAGRSINAPWGCELPKNQKLIQIEVAPDFDSEAAIFTGSVK